ncbi:MAG TPA: type I restriction endonuclease, partial [Burkholderiaceae bacterium]|nr:type I restriction endonuclease [Burkholderiaceae bacterium]
MADGAAAPGAGQAATLQWLCRQGWHLLSAPEQEALRGGMQGLLLAPRLAEALQARRFHYKGQRHPLSAHGIAQAVRQVAATSLAEGLLPANEQLYNQVAGGVTVSELMPDGKRHQPTIALIDWHDPAANRWDVAELPSLPSAQGLHACSPGLVCFVNGIPLVVIEAAATLEEALARHLRHQRQGGATRLYAYAQLLVALSGPQARYGTTGTPAAQWLRWCDEEVTDAQAAEPAAQGPGRQRRRPPATETDRLLAALLQPERLLEFLRVFVLFDPKAGKVVARPEQVIATRAVLACLHACTPGGLVCQAQGSGLGFTMAFVAKALLLQAQLPACRVVVVADRPGLEDRLARNCRGSGSFGPVVPAQGGPMPARAGTGRHVAWRIGQGSERLVFTTARRFNRALRLAECRNASADLVVLADEGWWRPDGPAPDPHVQLRRALPHAACVAFSDTDDAAASPCGPVTYPGPMPRALADGEMPPPHDLARWGGLAAQEPAGLYQV